MKILSLDKRQIPFPRERDINKGVYYVPYIGTSLTISPSQYSSKATKGFAYLETYNDSINTEWLKLSEKISMKVNGNLAQFKKS